MAPVVLTPAVDLTHVKMKWREVYVSEGLNKKLTPSQAPGIYRGLEIGFDGTQGAGDRRIAVTPDAATGDHTAVYQTQDGYSLTYADPAGPTIIFDLSNASLDSTETVIVMFMNYAIGVDTTAEFRAYTITDYNALSAGVRGELLVLGTVDVPAAAANITVGMIRFDRKTWAWQGVAKGALPWSPILRNPGFDWGSDVTSNTGPGGIAEARYGCSFWEAYATSGNISFLRSTTSPHSGGGCMELSFGATGIASGIFRQSTLMVVEEGQLLRARVWVDVLQAKTAGNVYLSWDFHPQSAGAPLEITEAIDFSGVTGGYVEIDKTILAPPGPFKYALKGMGIRVAGLNVAGTGVAARFDDFQCWLETPDVEHRLQDRSARMAEVSAYPLVLDDPVLPKAAAAPLLRYSFNAKELIGQRRDRQDEDGSALLPPVLNWFGTVKAGEGLMETTNDLEEVARFAARYLSSNGPTSAEMTLILESEPDGTNEPWFRMYVQRDGGLWMTWNCKWDDSANVWSADTDYYDASSIVFGGEGGNPIFQHRFKNVVGPLPVTWARTTWDGVGFSHDSDRTTNSAVIGRQLRLGTDLLSDAAAASAVRARLISTADASGVSTFTLLWEMEPNSGSVSTRIYVRENGDFWATNNAVWGSGGTWTKDDNARACVGLVFESSVNSKIRFIEKPNDEDTPWSTAIDGVNWHDAGYGVSSTSSDMSWWLPDFLSANRVHASLEPPSGNGYTNTMTAINIVKCWGAVEAGEFSGPILMDGFNVTSVTALGSTLQVNIANDMANTDYCIVAVGSPNLGISGPDAVDYFLIVTAQATSSFVLEGISHAGTTQSIAGGLDTKVYFAVIGEQ